MVKTMETKTVKKKVAKICKTIKKTVDGKDQLVVRYRHVDKKKVKELKLAIDACAQQWLQTIVPEE